MLAWLAAAALAVNPYLDQGQAHFNAQRFEEAAERLALAVKVPTATADEKQLAFDLLARARLAMGDEPGALRSYRELVTAFPHGAGPGSSASPKVRAAYLRAKEEVYPKGTVRLTRLTSSAQRLELELVDPWSAVARVRLRVNGVDRDEVPSAERRVAFELPARAGFKAEALGPDGAVLASLEEAGAATADVPVAAAAAVVVEPAVSASRPSRAPAWVLVAAGVAAGITGGVLTGVGFGTAGSAQQAAVALDSERLNVAARQQAIAGWAVLGVGAALLVGGLLWWLLS